jgi:hypothetical protein
MSCGIDGGIGAWWAAHGSVCSSSDVVRALAHQRIMARLAGRRRASCRPTAYLEAVIAGLAVLLLRLTLA